MEDVRGFVDKRAGGQHTGRHGLAAFCLAADGARLAGSKNDIGAALDLPIFVLLGLVVVEPVIAEPHPKREFGGRAGRILGGAGRIEGDGRACGMTKLAHDKAAEADVVEGLWRHVLFDFALPILAVAIAAGPNHDQPLGGEPGRRDEIERGQSLPLELDGGGRLPDQRLSSIANEATGRRAESEILAHENDQSPRVSGFAAGPFGRGPRLNRQRRERDKFDFHCFGHLFLCRAGRAFTPACYSVGAPRNQSVCSSVPLAISQNRQRARPLGPWFDPIITTLRLDKQARGHPPALTFAFFLAAAGAGRVPRGSDHPRLGAQSRKPPPVAATKSCVNNKFGVRSTLTLNRNHARKTLLSAKKPPLLIV